MQIFRVVLTLAVVAALYLATYRKQWLPDTALDDIALAAALVSAVWWMIGAGVRRLRVEKRARRFRERILGRLRDRVVFRRLLRDFVDREEELAVLESAVRKRVARPRVLYVSAFPGLGKSYLLNFIRIQRWRRTTHFIECNEGETFVSSLLRTFRSLDPYGSRTQYELLKQAASRVSSGTLFLVDEFQYRSSSFQEEFVFFLEKLSEQEKDVVTVAAGRLVPTRASHHFTFLSLKPFSVATVRQLIAERVEDLEHRKTLLADAEGVTRATEGNPKILHALLKTPSIWTDASSSEGGLASVEEVRDVLLAAWESAAAPESEDFKSALRTLAAVSRVAPTWSDDLGARLFGVTAWARLRRDLEARGVLEAYPSGKMKFHDLFAEHVYRSTPAGTRRDLHLRICTAYLELSSGDSRERARQLERAFRHAGRGGDSDRQATIFLEHRDSLLTAASLPVLAEELAKISAALDETSRSAAQKIERDLGYCLSMSGEYTRALEVFDRVLEAADEDCAHLEITCERAFVAHSLGSFREAVLDLEKLLARQGCPREVEERALSIRAHCRAHLGAFRQAEAEFDELMRRAGLTDETRANCLWGSAWVARALGRRKASARLAQQCVELARPAGLHRAHGLALWNQATVQRVRGDHDGASALMHEARSVLENYGIRSAMHILVEEAEILRARGALRRAREVYGAAIERSTRDLIDRDFEMHARLGLVETERLLGEADPQAYEAPKHYFLAQGVSWAALSADVGQFLCSWETEGAMFDEARWREIHAEASGLAFAAEIELLESVRARAAPGARRAAEPRELHPLFFM